jgi:hypothetical protein
MSDPRDKTNVIQVSKTAKPKSPPAPGGASSPQQPGKTPDRSSIPGHFRTRVDPPTTKQRPLSQYGSAEEIMQVFKRVPEGEIVPASFEQATASYEELRKASVALLPPGHATERAVDAGESPVAIPAETV